MSCLNLTQSIFFTHLIKYCHCKLLVGNTMGGVTSILIVTISNVIVNSVQYVLLQETLNIFFIVICKNFIINRTESDNTVSKAILKAQNKANSILEFAIYLLTVEVARNKNLLVIIYLRNILQHRPYVRAEIALVWRRY